MSLYPIEKKTLTPSLRERAGVRGLSARGPHPPFGHLLPEGEGI